MSLDSANDHISYPCAFDERSLVILEKITAVDELGPSGGVLYTFDELDAKWECLKDRLRGLEGEWRIQHLVGLRCGKLCEG